VNAMRGARARATRNGEAMIRDLSAGTGIEAASACRKIGAREMCGAGRLLEAEASNRVTRQAGLLAFGS
jgi:hypothetical protein